MPKHRASIATKFCFGAATTLSLALTTASVLWVYHDGKRSDLRINMQMAWVFASCIFVTIAFFRKKILAQPRFRRVSQLLLLLGGYLVVGRTIGVTQGYTAGPFLIQEMVGIALFVLGRSARRGLPLSHPAAPLSRVYRTADPLPRMAAHSPEHRVWSRDIPGRVLAPQRDSARAALTSASHHPRSVLTLVHPEPAHFA